MFDLSIYRVTRCFALSAVDFTFSLRSLVTTVVVVTVLVVFLALTVAVAAVGAAAAAGVSFFLVEAAASFVSFFGAIQQRRSEKEGSLMTANSRLLHSNG